GCDLKLGLFRLAGPRPRSTTVRSRRNFGRYRVGPNHASPVVSDQTVNGGPWDFAIVGRPVEAQGTTDGVFAYVEVDDGDCHVEANLQDELGLRLEPRRHEHFFSARI